MATGESKSYAFIGRQTIYGSDMATFGYELLFRSRDENHAIILDGEAATTQVVANTFLEIGLDKIVGSHRAFINFSHHFLIEETKFPFPPDKVVIELLEDVEPTDRLITAIDELLAQGYLFALDDFVFREDLLPLVKRARFIKIDVAAHDRQALSALVGKLRNRGVKLLAEKVETQDEYVFCKQLGFEYFQGFLFAKPKIIKGQRLPANKASTLQLLAELQAPDVEIKSLENIIQRDVALSFRLLRYINSASFGLRNKIESIRHAAVYLGLRHIRTWAGIIALSGLDDKPTALMTTALVRAKMCELICSNQPQRIQDTFFTVGLFSTLDIFLDTPMETILASLPLSTEISDAILHLEGKAGEALSLTLAYERGDWDSIEACNMPEKTLADAYLQAIQWADQAASDLSTIS